MYLNESVTRVKGVGKKTAAVLSKLGIFTVGDLVTHFPRKYESYGEIVPVEFLNDRDTSVIECMLKTAPSVFSRNGMKITRCTVHDSTGSIEVFWFSMPFIGRSLKAGTKYLLRGKVSIKGNRKMLIQPKILSKQDYLNNKNKYMPVYPLTDGVTNNALRKYVTLALGNLELTRDKMSSEYGSRGKTESDNKQDSDLYGRGVLSQLPPGTQKKYDLIRLDSALKKIHFPENADEYIKARKRLVFDEFYSFFLDVIKVKKEKQHKKNEYKFDSFNAPENLIKKLPFNLTEGQRKAWEDIKSDLKKECVMRRLIQGDVGCGKTIVALLAAVSAVENGYQAVIMAPTQVLARQHYRSCVDFLKDIEINGRKVKIELLDSSVTAGEKKRIYSEIKRGEANIVIGTHAVITEKTEFAALALAITDEQHRFGVIQKKILEKKGKDPNVLVMSATPIPRSLASVVFGDLDISIINTMPSGRKPVKNCAVDITYRKAAYNLISEEVRKGHQAYVICPMVDESENVEAENCIEYTEKLRKALSPDIRVECVHGRMKGEEKDEKLESFAAGEIKVLVSTTVVEVGIDVPNATVMLIENADRFGLASLHQLRGRIGRGSAQSYCIFMTDRKLSESREKNDMLKAKRLDIISHSNDGFEIARKDLENRGPGDIDGIRQSGMPGFKLADICQDADIMKEAWETALNR